MTRFCLTFFAVVVVLSGSLLAQAQTDGLLLYMPFDDGGGDTALNTVGEDGLLMESPQWVAGKFGGALEFDGVSNYVEIPVDLSPQAPGNQGAMTICAWVKVLDVNTDGHPQTRQPIVVKGGGGEWEYALYAYDNFGAGLSIWSCGDPGVSEPSAAGTIPQEEWHHVCGTFDVTNGATVYVDAVEVAKQKPNANEPCDGSVNLRVASRLGGQFLKAVIDEVAMWDHVLTLSDIEQNMAGGLTAAVEPGDKLATTWAVIKAR